MMRVFESRVLRKIFGPKRDEVTGNGGDFCNEELRDLCRLPKENESAKECGTYGGKEMCMQGFGGENSGKDTAWKTQASNINMDVQEVGWGGAWMGLMWLMIETICELFRTRLYVNLPFT
jgi:hypothetical protein